jgi:hypothetical protein
MSTREVGEQRRAWRTPGGEILVEWEREPTVELSGVALRAPDGQAAPPTFVYHCFSRSGALLRTYRAIQWSLDDSLVGAAYAVIGDTLVEFINEVAFGQGPASEALPDPGGRATPVMSGLAPLLPAHAPAPEQVRKALGELIRRRAAYEAAELREQEERLRGFAEALPEYPEERELRFLWEYDYQGTTTAIVIRRTDGSVLWRDISYPYSGKYLFPQLRGILERRYGERLSGFAAHLPDARASLDFDPN